MSISRKYLFKLKEDFLEKSPEIKKLKSKKENIIKYIESMLSSKFLFYPSKEEYNILNMTKDFWLYRILKISNQNKSFLINIYVTRLCPITETGYINIDELGDIKEEIKKEGDKLLEIVETLNSIKESFCRLVNRRTSLVWLRKNMPEVYKKLKSYD